MIAENTIENEIVVESCFKLIKAVEQEEKKSSEILHMTANENIISQNVRRLIGSSLSSRYYSDTYDSENNPSKNCYTFGNAVYRGLPAVHAFEEEARVHANRMFHAQFTDFIALSGLHAVLCMVSTITKPGDKIFIFSPTSIGHHATENLLKNLGRIPVEIPWDYENIQIDLEKFSEVFHKENPTAIFLDLGKSLYPLNVKAIREIVGSGIKIIYDASHVLGLIAGGLFQNPLEEGADILIGNTHKTFPGPQKAILLYADKEFGRKISLDLFSCAVSSQHTHHSLALYATIMEMAVHGKAYAQQIKINSEMFSMELLNMGFTLISRKNELPHSHMIAISGVFPENALEACRRLHMADISTNTQKIFGTDCVRIGVQEVTRRGMKEAEMQTIAHFFKRIIFDRDHTVKDEVREFNSLYKKIFYTLDDLT